MSKPIARYAFIVLISLVLIAATSASVRGWLGGTSNIATVQSHVVNGMQTNLNHDRATTLEQQSLKLQSELNNNPANSSRMEGGCHSDHQTAPQD